jgi:ABC-type Na+ efflux pump permease subunit
MRFLSIAERELRAAARRRGLYRLRWITAAAFFVLLLWLSWVFDLFKNRSAGPDVFQAFSVVTFLYCLFVGAAGTADSLSREKREGTLGLLFLTNLNSAEIVAGKLCANALATFYSLLAIFPILALPVLIGGITFGHFWRTVLALVNALFFAIAAGFVASAVSVRQFPAIALATGLALVFGLALLGAAAAMRKFGFPTFFTDAVAAFCPLHTMLSANDSSRTVNQSQFWISLATVAGISWTWLALVAWRIGRTWRDRPKSVRVWSRLDFGNRYRERGRAARAALRRRFLEINPFFWLAARQRVSGPIFMLLTVVLVVITITVTAPLFGRVIGAGALSPMVGHLFAWLWTGLALHALVLYYGATVASQRLAEDKQTGALELILSTPATERSISRGLWLAYGRKMFFPALMAVLVHCYFLWQCAAMFVLEPPGKLPPGTTPWQLLWCIFLDQPIRGFRLEWHFGFMLGSAALVLVVLITTWIAAGWLGRWLGLRMKHPGFAPLATVALLLVPPVLLFSLTCYLFDEWNVNRMPERQFLPLMKWIAFGIGIGHCLLVSAWAAGRLRHDFRTTVMSRFQPPLSYRWWRPSRRTLLRFAVGTTVLALLVVSAVLFFYGYQNRQGQRRWTAFQKQLQQRGESLDLSSILPGSVTAAQNFAQTPAFQNLLNQKPANKLAAALLAELGQHSGVDATLGPANKVLQPWSNQAFADLDEQLAWIVPKFKPAMVKDRTNSAAAVWDGLKPLQEDAVAAASAAHLPFFQATTSRGADAVYQSNLPELSVMEQLHFLFHLRACALLALDGPIDSGENVLTSLRLAQLARQSPDLKSPFRVQVMLGRSLQPIWEGMVEHRWSEAQLAAFQSELARFNLLADHTNAIRRVVLAHIETWRAVPDAKTPVSSVPQGGGGYVSQREWAWQPRVWWYDNCIQLYEAGRNAVDRVDVAAGRMTTDYNWRDLSGLPLDGVASQLFQQGSWWGNSLTLVSFAQTAVNQAITACALERYRLAHGDYPETLDPLLRTFLDRIPPDITRGRPLIYERNDKDSYTLRGAGANGIIDQAKATSDDWLWSFPSATNATPGTVTNGK